MKSKQLLLNLFEYEVEKLRERNHSLDILSQYSTALLGLTSGAEVINYTTQEVIECMGFTDCVIYLWNAKDSCLKQHLNLDNKEHFVALGEGNVGRAAQLMKAIIVNDLQTNRDCLLNIVEAKSELAIPIIHSGQLIGVISSKSQEKHFYHNDRVQMLTTVAAMLSAKLMQTQLISRLEESIAQLESAEKLQKVLFNIASLTYEDENLNSTYVKLHSLVAQLFDAKSFFIAIYHEDEKCIHFPYFVDENYPSLQPDQGPIDPELKGLSAWVIFNNQSLLLTKAEVLMRIKSGVFHLIDDMPLPESWLGVPMLAGDLKGALVVQTYRSSKPYTEKDRELLTYVSHHVCNLLQRKLFEQKLRYQALHDALTGLANRTLFLNRVDHALKMNERHHTDIFAILYMDIDFFKQINDSYGHLVGDALLVEFAKLLKLQSRESDTVARLGGDEFAIFIEDLEDRESAYFLAKRILQTLECPIQVSQFSIKASTSIGIAVINGDGISVSEGIRRADLAMYKAKLLGRSNYQVYDSTFDTLM